jgi:hypothetical protein
MKLSDIFGELNYKIGNAILELPIVEQASKANEAQSKINSLSVELIEHLVKIYKWNDEQNIKNHLSDISGWMYKISRVRVANNKRPTYDQCINWVIKDIFSDVDELTTLINSLKKYHHLPIKNSDEQVSSIIMSILEPFCKDIASGTFKDAYDYLERVE